MEHDRARVEDGPSGVRGEQVSGPLDDLGVAGSEGCLQHALERQQPVHVAGQLVQNASVERAHESAGALGLPGGEPQEAGLGAHDGNSLGGRELLALGRDDGARGRVTGLHGGVALHGLDHHPGVGKAGPLGRRDGQLDQPGRGVGAPAQQVEHQPPRRREELRARRFLAQPLEGAHVPVDGLDVQRLARHLQAPQVRLQPGVRVEDVRGDLVELAGQLHARLQVIRAPVRGECGVEAVGEQLRDVHALRSVHRLVRELHRPRGLARVDPAPGERGSDAGPVRVVGGADQHVVELGGQPARLGAEDVAPMLRRAPRASTRRGRRPHGSVRSPRHTGGPPPPRPAARAASARSRRSRRMRSPRLILVPGRRTSGRIS